MTDFVPLDPPRPVRFTQRTWVVVVVLLALIASLMCWRHLRDGRPHAAPGTTFPATGPLGRTTPSSVILPSGELDIRATGPLDDVEADPAVRGQQPPDGGSFVGLQIVRGDDSAVSRYGFGETTVRKPVATSFALVADGRRYAVRPYDAYGQESDDAGSGSGFVSQRVYVAVAGRPTRLELEVTYADARQTVDLRTGAREPGRFAPLYANRPVDRDCGAATLTAGFAADPGPGRACAVDLVQRTPYYPAYGWAPSGQTWLVVGVRTTEPEGLRYRDGSRFARYESYGLPKVTVTLDGRAAKATGLFSNVLGSTRYDVSLFAAEAASTSHRLGVTVAYETSLRSDSARAGLDYDRNVTATWRTAL